MTKQLTGANEVESIAALAAKTFARVLELERQEGAALLGADTVSIPLMMPSMPLLKI